MDYATKLHVLDGLNELVHDQRNFLFFQLIGFDVFKKLATSNLLHDDEHVFLVFVALAHLDDISMRYKFYDLSLLPKEFSFALSKLYLVNLLHSHNLLSLLIFALINYRELSVTELAPSDVLGVEAQVVRLFFQVFYPVLDNFLVTMIKDTGFETFLLVKDNKSIIFRVFVIFDLVDIEAFQ